VAGRLVCHLVALVCAALALPAVAAASYIVDRNVRSPTLKVDASGHALVQYTRANGTRRNVLFWGAANGVANSDEERPQIRFKVDYSGGWRAFHDGRYWRRLRNACRPYDSPQLVLAVAACKAPDGSYWALQEWVRLAAMRGFAPFKPEQTAVELHLSHWTGDLPRLEVWPNWTYGGTKQGFFGRLVYQGAPVYGRRTPSSSVGDAFAQTLFIDTLNSVYGPGWKRDTAITTHVRSGGFCYTFVAQVPPPGYPSREPRGPGLGERHRVTAMGPGVTPVVRWEGARLGPYDREEDARINRTFDAVLGGDQSCGPER
jgi:hypothetical protein